MDFIQHSGAVTKIKRTTTRGNPSFRYADEAEVCLIESNRIEQFVIDTKKSLWQRFSDLLGFEHLILFDNQLFRLKTESKNKYDDANIKLIQLKEEFDTLKSDINGLEELFREELGDNWRNNINMDSGSNEAEAYHKFEKLTGNIDKFIKNYEELEIISNDLYSNKELLLREKDTSESSELTRIVSESYKYFSKFNETNICPVCGQIIKFDEVFSRLKVLHDYLSNIRTLEEKISKLSIRKDNLEDNLNLYSHEISKIYAELFGDRIDENMSRSDMLALIDSVKPNIINEKEVLYKKVSIKERIGIYQAKRESLLKLEGSLKDQSQVLELKKLLCRDVAVFYENYIRLYSEKIKIELDQICKNDVVEIYKLINQSDNESIEEFIIEPDIDEKEISFLAKIKNTSQTVNATEFLSTGHLRCLGFALLMARINTKVNNLNFLVIDDPIYSIDHEHRYNLIQYLSNLGERYQLVITSSDRLFFDILRHNFNNNKFISYETFASNHSGIITLNLEVKQNQYINEARSYLETNDLRAASLYARLSLETKLFNLAEKLKLEIPINRRDKTSMKDLMDANLKTKLLDKYRDNVSIHRSIDIEFNKLYDHRYFKTILKGFPLDHEVHHPYGYRLFYSKKEVEDVIDSVEAFCEFIDELPKF